MLVLVAKACIIHFIN